MSVEDLTEMIRMLQQRMEEMQQHHEAEMAVARAECSVHITQEKGSGAREKKRIATRPLKRAQLSIAACRIQLGN